MSMIYGFKAASGKTFAGVNLLDAARILRHYETKDGKYVARSIEPQFYAELRERAGLSKKSGIGSTIARRGRR